LPASGGGMTGPFTASVSASWRVADIARLWHEADRKVPVVRRWPLPPIDDDAHKEQELNGAADAESNPNMPISVRLLVKAGREEGW